MSDGFDLRDYQTEAVESVFRQWDNNIRSTMVVLPTGCGKTVVASSIAERLWERHHTKEDLYSGAILFLAHREELITQTHAKFRKHIPDAKIAIEMADYRAYGQLHRKPEIVIASTSSMLSRYKKYPKDYFGAAFVDECFPAGTLVDGRAIETIQPGDLVQSFNHETNLVESRKVLRVSKRPAARLVRVVLQSGQTFVCTPEHPFFAADTAGESYVPAEKLTAAHSLLKVYHESVSAIRCELHELRNGSDRLKGDASGAPDHKSQEAGTDLLLPGVHEAKGESGEFSTNGDNESEARQQQNENAKSDVRGRASGENASVDEGEMSKGAGREWSWMYLPADPLAGGFRADDSGCGDGIRCGHEEQAATSETLQDRHRITEQQTVHRGGWEQSLPACSEGAGQAKGSVSDWHRVHSVEVLEQTSDGEFGGVCAGGTVHNLEVEGNHNYFVDGYLVHNCHHSVGKSYTEPLGHFNDNLKFLLGLTATPKRHDGKAMGRMFDEVAFKMTLLQAIDKGWILEPRIERISVAEMNLQNVSVVAGDFSKSSLSKEMSRETVIGKMVSETIIRAAGRQTAIYCVDVDHMRAVEQQLKQRGQTCGLIDGKTPGPVRKSKLRDFRERTIQFLISCGTLTEGWDCPECEVIAMFRPTQSCSLYEQIVGRGLRPLFPPMEDTPELRRAAIAASEKPFCIVLDFVGNSRHKLANIGDILGGTFDDEVKRLAMDLARHETGPIDMRELLKKAEQILDEQRAKRFQKGTGRDKLTRALWQLNPHPYDVLGLDKEHAESAVSRDDAYGRAPIEAAETLERYKLKPHEIQRLTNKQQVLLARVILSRSRRGLCSYAQARLLYRFGYDANLPVVAAAKVLDQVNANGDWWRPDADGINRRLVEIAEQPENRWLRPYVEEEIQRHEKLNNVLPFV